eukprot:CAMPEP_0170421222 /NCGR_PEP_ID=MMETSP0117_2-20130122/35781_1 /TAXON_ID=400756 /ORGANISM="Durinskia baltica, Strain CSIRO CS-38" /LENGTH=96 /DNA_ID=CAMNT_0010679753 /DNA_START=187 /DNA_END=478 /DNA_ORIENTATION=-
MGGRCDFVAPEHAAICSRLILSWKQGGETPTSMLGNEQLARIKLSGGRSKKLALSTKVSNIAEEHPEGWGHEDECHNAHGDVEHHPRTDHPGVVCS